MGKFARVGLGTRHIDYNGRLCMVSAGTAYKGHLGVDRAPNPWSDIAAADVIFAIGANIGECAPITTDYIWRARDNGAKLIVADPAVDADLAQRRPIPACAAGNRSRAPYGNAPRDRA